jgi:hypothetical protein
MSKNADDDVLMTSAPIADPLAPDPVVADPVVAGPVVAGAPSAEGRLLRITDRTLTLDDMLRFAAGSGYSGLLRVEASSTGELAIDGGRVVAARLSGGVGLDDVLMRRAGDDRSEPAVAAAVLEHVVEVLLELELATTGTTTLELAGGDAGPVPHQIRLDVDDVLDAKHARLREWKQIAVRMPPADAVLHVAADLPPGQVTIDGDDWRVLLALRDGATVAHVVRAVGMGAFCACRSVLRLLEAGAVEVAAQAPAIDRGRS